MLGLKIINPKGLQFAYGFTKDECYKISTGKCSLKEPFDQTVHKKISKNKADKSYCQRLYVALVKDKVYFKDISIHKTGCGHYDFTNGRHRVCISQSKGLNFEGEISKGLSLCIDCENQRVPKQMKTNLEGDYTILVKDWEEY